MKLSFLTLFLALFYAVGFGILGYACWSAWRSSLAARWPITTGTLEACDLASHTDSDGDTTYEVEVAYRYTVDMQQYTGKRLAFGYTASSGRAAHAQIHEKLKRARAVDVRYDPRDPSSATLSFGMHRSIRMLFAFGVTWLAFVTGFSVIWWVASGGDDVLLRNLVAH